MDDYFAGLPENICEWLRQNDGVNVSVNFCSASANCGYTHRILKTVVISMLTRTCVRCGYDPMWNPDDTESKCLRHTYTPYRYDDVFTWEERKGANSIEDDFSKWLDANPKNCGKPMVMMFCGRLVRGRIRRYLPDLKTGR